MGRILVIDDDIELCELLVEYLGGEGFEVECAHEADTGLARARSGEHLLVVLDVMLPGQSGFDVLRRLRVDHTIPVLMLTARGQDVDRIVGLEMGADDYLAKPFNPRELVARVRAITRRAAQPTVSESVLTDGPLEMIPSARTARIHGEVLALTTAELDVLEVLLRQAGQVVSREELCQRALGRRHSAFDRSVDVHVSNLRRKLGPDLGDRVKTVRGHGYLWARDVAPA